MRLGLLAGVMMALGLSGCKQEPPKPHVNYDAADPRFYVQDVQPIFKANCARCHGGMNRKGGYSMQSAAGLVRGGKHGVAVVPGDPAGSLLVRLLRHEPAATGVLPEPGPMPDKKKKLSDADIATVERWVKAGAVMPADGALR